MTFPYLSDPVFCEAVHHIVNSEGGDKVTNDPRDPGGPTKYGIAFNFNQKILASFGITDIHNLTEDVANQIYYVKYWLPSEGDRIHDKRLGYMHFDTAVNCGIGTASKILESLSKDPRNYAGNGANDALWLSLLVEYTSKRIRYYTSLKRSLQIAYLAGWMNRLSDVQLNCLKMGA